MSASKKDVKKNDNGFFSRFLQSWKTTITSSRNIPSDILGRVILTNGLLESSRDEHTNKLAKQFNVPVPGKQQISSSELFGAKRFNLFSWPYTILLGARNFIFKAIDHLDYWPKQGFNWLYSKIKGTEYTRPSPLSYVEPSIIAKGIKGLCSIVLFIPELIAFTLKEASIKLFSGVSNFIKGLFSPKNNVPETNSLLQKDNHSPVDELSHQASKTVRPPLPKSVMPQNTVNHNPSTQEKIDQDSTMLNTPSISKKSSTHSDTNIVTDKTSQHDVNAKEYPQNRGKTWEKDTKIEPLSPIKPKKTAENEAEIEALLTKTNTNIPHSQPIEEKKQTQSSFKTTIKSLRESESEAENEKINNETISVSLPLR